jgi:hypothetical protein
MASERRFYLCSGVVVGYSKLHTHPSSHILGEIVNLTEDGKRVTALAVWDVSALTTEVPPLNPPVSTWAMEARVKCRRCHHQARWQIGDVAFSVLMERYGYGRETEVRDLRRAAEIPKVVEPQTAENRGTG